MELEEVGPFIERFPVQFALIELHAHALAGLYRAGRMIINEPEAPRWFHAQRVIVAVARSRLASFEPSRRASAREQEARTLLRLRDYANRRARDSPATTRRARRRRRRLEALAREWQELADLVLYGEAN